jgi:Protein-L-isoaspartate(D-aspartate) O-methyltransferase (PCMT)
VTIPAYVTGDRFMLETVSRQQSQVLRLVGPAVLCRVLGKYLMFADADDFSVAPPLSLNGYWEPWTTLAIARALRPGMRAVDVGANHGYFSLLMADAAGHDGRVLAIEPNPRLAELLTRTFEVNGFRSRAAVLVRAAAASSGSTARLAIPPHRWADATIQHPPAPDDDVIDGRDGLPRRCNGRMGPRRFHQNRCGGIRGSGVGRHAADAPSESRRGDHHGVQAGELRRSGGASDAHPGAGLPASLHRR